MTIVPFIMIQSQNEFNFCVQDSILHILSAQNTAIYKQKQIFLFCFFKFSAKDIVFWNQIIKLSILEKIIS